MKLDIKNVQNNVAQNNNIECNEIQHKNTKKNKSQRHNKTRITHLSLWHSVKGQRKTFSKLKLRLMALNMIEFSINNQNNDIQTRDTPYNNTEKNHTQNNDTMNNDA